MSFGFSVGDFIAIGKLICDITSCLQSVGGAKSDYQELIREFELLDAALRHLDQLDNTTSASTRLDAIKYAALSCRLPLEEFLDKARKYEKSLGIWNKVHIVKSTTNKLGWTFKQKDEIKRLQTYLNVHIGTINILLTEYGLEKMDMADRRAEADCARVRNQLQDTHIILEEVRRSLPDQALLLRNVHSMVRGIHKLVCGEMKSSLEHIGRMVRKVCVSTQQIYTIVLEIRASVTIADTRWTHFQAPFSVEDALGFKFPIPSEYDYDMVETIIRRRFKEGTGSQDVIAGNYELCKAQKRSETITATSRLVPGTAIIMAVIVSIAESSDSSCPIPQCGSRTILSCPGGGHTCAACNVWFDRATKKRRFLDDSTNSVEELTEPAATGMVLDASPDRKRRSKKRRLEDEDQSSLRNVRWTPIAPLPCTHREDLSIAEGNESSYKVAKRALSNSEMDVGEIIRSMARRRKSPRPSNVMHPCRDCKKEFKRPCDLTKHEKIHLRPWKCPKENCKYSYIGWPTEKELDRHVNDKHSGPPPQYKCLYPPCTYAARRESNCARHMEKAHGWEYVRPKSNGQKKGPTSSTTPMMPLIETPQSAAITPSSFAIPFIRLVDSTSPVASVPQP